MNHIEKDLTQKRIEIANWIFLAVLFIPSLIFAPLKFALGVLLGGFISIINFHWLGRGLQSAFQNMGEKGNIKTPVMVKYYIRLAITGIILYLLIAGNIVNVIGLIVGLSVVVINIIITLITTIFLKKNCLEEVV
ncbi:MAG: ATP synthase subunit I [Smithellaceae bacterium]